MNLTQSQYVQVAIDEYRTLMERLLCHVDNLEDSTLQLICMFAMIDCMAQEVGNFSSKNNKEVFCNFVLTHQSHGSYLNMVEPVTLFYHVEENIDKIICPQDNKPTKPISLDSLDITDFALFKDVPTQHKVEEILAYLEKEVSQEFADERRNQHRLISLIYRMRNKVIHEMTAPGEGKVLLKDDDMHEPFYRCISRIYMSQGKQVFDEPYTFHIPNSFIRSILLDCLKGYLAECNKQQRAPSSNNKFPQKRDLAWYDLKIIQNSDS